MQKEKEKEAETQAEAVALCGSCQSKTLMVFWAERATPTRGTVRMCAKSSRSERERERAGESET